MTDNLSFLLDKMVLLIFFLPAILFHKSLKIRHLFGFRTGLVIRIYETLRCSFEVRNLHEWFWFYQVARNSAGLEHTQTSWNGANHERTVIIEKWNVDNVVLCDQ